MINFLNVSTQQLVDLENITFEQAQQLIMAQQSQYFLTTPLLGAVGESKEKLAERCTDESFAFFRGDHWQKGTAWVGPKPDPNDNESDAALENIRREFSSRNVIKEVVTRHRDGVIGREIEWSFLPRRSMPTGTTPTAEEQKRIDEAHALMTEWWNERGIGTILQYAIDTLLVGGRSVLRIYVPPAELEELDGEAENSPRQTVVPRADLQTSLKRIFLLHPDYNQAGVVTDAVTMRQVGLYVYQIRGERFVEISYLDKDGQTITRVVGGNATDQSAEGQRQEQQKNDGTNSSDPMPLSRHLTIYEMWHDPLVTDQLKQNQKALNRTKTLRGHAMNEAGFPETNLLNVNLPGTLEPDPQRPGGTRFVPDPIKRGASVINSWVGVEVTSEDGKKSIAKPSIQRSDPVKIESFTKSERADYEDMLGEVEQTHVLIEGDATSAAIARIQSKAGFRRKMLPTKTQVDGMARWLLETVLTMAAVFSGEPDRFGDLRANADCQLDTGPVTPEEITVAASMGDRGYWSRARVQRLSGVEDTAAEDSQIEDDRKRFPPPPLTKAGGSVTSTNLKQDAAGEGL
jgi:hypothetical protein